MTRTSRTTKKSNLKWSKDYIYTEEEEGIFSLKFDPDTGEEVCDICGELLSISVEGDCTVTCGTCKMKVHKGCILYRGKVNKYECDLCKNKLKNTPPCEFCPIMSLRSMKQNSQDPSKWSHISCITFLPGANMNEDNETYTNNVSPQQYRRRCEFCKSKEGAVVYCSHRSCRKCFHVLCGRLNDCVFGWDEEKDCAIVLCQVHGKATYNSSYCEICRSTKNEESLLLCDGCDKGYHLFCLDPQLKVIPEGEWYCPKCLKKRILSGNVLVIKSDTTQKTVKLSSEYVKTLAESRLIDRKRPSLKSTNEDENSDMDGVSSDDEEDEGLGFYEMKKMRKSRITSEDKPVNINIDSIPFTDFSECIHTLLQEPPKHIERGKVMRFIFLKQFQSWKSELIAGFNILLTGLGSKYNLLSVFQEKALKDERCIVINGFNPSFALTDILHILCDNYFQLNYEGMRYESLMKEVKRRVGLIQEHLFIVIHSIDGEGLRDTRLQDYISELAKQPMCHVIASIDHIRGNLLFSAKSLADYDFIYHDTTTFEPYFYEKMYTKQISQANGGRSASGVSYILSSLTTNHLKILMLLCREGGKTKNGLSFSTFYDLCLCEMLVSSEKSLQLILKELEDHELVKRTNSSSPQENYVCCVSAKELKSFCDNLYNFLLINRF